MTSLSTDFPLEETENRIQALILRSETIMNFANNFQKEVRRSDFEEDSMEKKSLQEVDSKVGDYLIQLIQGIYPQDGILCEGKDEISGESSFRWIIDPIDGSMNFLRGNPLFTIGIGLEYRKSSIASIVYVPRLEDVYQCIYGKSTLKNGIPIQTSKARNLSQSIFTPNIPSLRQNQINEILSEMTSFITYARSFRRSGSFLLDMCWLSEGLLDGIWERSASFSDSTIGCILVNHAGGSTTDLEGRTIYSGNSQVIASNGLIHKELLEVLQRSRRNFNPN
jgi:myo-inositol-1(or 4)-monophosphatase